MNDLSKIPIYIGGVLVLFTLYWMLKGRLAERREKKGSLISENAIFYIKFIGGTIGVIFLSVIYLFAPQIWDWLFKLRFEHKYNSEQEYHAPAHNPALLGFVRNGMTRKRLPATIRVMSEGELVQTFKCDSNGEFEIRLEDGNYEFMATYPGFVSYGRDDDWHKFSIHGRQFDYDKVVLWPEAKVTGRVVSGNSGVDAELKFFYIEDNADTKNYLFKTIRTDENGDFTLDKAYGGIQRIELSADGFISQELTNIELEPGETVQLGEIPMKQGLKIYGIVKDKSSKKGIPDATIRFVDLSRKVLVETKTAADGSYTLPLTEMNKLQLSVTADGYMPNSKFIVAKDLSRYEHTVTLSKDKKKAKQKKESMEPLVGPDAQAAAKLAFDENETAFQEAMSIHLNDAPEGMPGDKYIQMQLPLKAAAISKAVEKYNEIINNYKSPEWEMASMIRIGTLFQSVADEIMAAPIPPDLPDDVENQYIALIDQFALQFMEKELDYYESALKISSDLNIVNEDVKRIENQVSNIRYK